MNATTQKELACYAVWYITRDDVVAAFTSRCFGPEGDQPGTVELRLEQCDYRGREYWRWSDGEAACGDARPSRDEAIEDAIRYANRHDAGDLIE